MFVAAYRLGDPAIGTAEYAGGIYMIPGPVYGTIDLSLETPVYGVNFNDQIGGDSPITMGDYDGDGLDDLVASSIWHDAGPNGQDVGATWILRGARWGP